MSKLTGRIDHLLRPIVRIEVGDESVLCLVDTGFNGELMICETDAKRLGFTILNDGVDIMLAGEQRDRAKQGIGTIKFMGEKRRIRIFVTPDRGVIRRGGDPIAMIGTGLLMPNTLFINFAEQTVEIKTQD